MTEKRRRRLTPETTISFLVVAGSICVPGWMIWLSSIRQDKGAGLTAVEVALFQAVILILGLAGSFFFGRVTSTTPQNAKSAFRRLVSLYQGLGRFLATIDERRQALTDAADGDTLPLDKALDTLLILEVQIQEKLQTIDDAVADWRDVAPDEVRELEDNLRLGSQKG